MCQPRQPSVLSSMHLANPHRAWSEGRCEEWSSTIEIQRLPSAMRQLHYCKGSTLLVFEPGGGMR